MYNLVKRSLDLVLSLFMILISLPLQLLIVIVLILEIKDNPLFVQQRGISLDSKTFLIYKFRTMRSGKNKSIDHNDPKEIFLLPNLAVELTIFTRWLRKSGLDELPQLFNVLKGDMSLVGPRPLMIQDLEIMRKEYPVEYEMRTKIKAKPGITGIWQVIGERSLGVENLLSYDLFYDQKKSFFLDLQILLVTLPIVLLAMNSDAIVPRLNLVRNFFSLTAAELVIINDKDNNVNKKSYTMKIPANWWYINNSYTSNYTSSKIYYISEGLSKSKMQKK
jgi:lipopolysaccharide/colanic/teichoic acid biosynthesis glycosyltransferase